MSTKPHDGPWPKVRKPWTLLRTSFCSRSEVGPELSTLLPQARFLPHRKTTTLTPTEKILRQKIFPASKKIMPRKNSLDMPRVKPRPAAGNPRTNLVAPAKLVEHDNHTAMQTALLSGADNSHYVNVLTQ